MFVILSERNESKDLVWVILICFILININNPTKRRFFCFEISVCYLYIFCYMRYNIVTEHVLNNKLKEVLICH